MMYMSCKGGGSKWFLLIKSSEGSSSTMFVLGMMPSSLGEKEKGKKTKIKNTASEQHVMNRKDQLCERLPLFLELETTFVF